ncbi:meiosis-specific serine threonine kinase mek1 [Fusarium circinatum]|uniref:Meiosis-specific serine threonine kinase mek1 n=1 Tax=Fusarium circinatum TaxID=48490 RepID=A0A8H5UG02_FUSCI|nr:meiosis-specific serine threonine kinase mek1 [Fusarium circinatum]
MDTDSRGSVASITRDSLLSFDVLISTLRSASYLHNQCISKKALSNQRDRLKIWASNTGALQSGNAALDARLRGFTVMKVAITECFEQLEHVISSNMDILQGQRLPVEQTLAEYQELWDSASDDSSDNEDKMNQKTEMGRNLVEIASIISDLFKLSFKLRNPAARLMGPQLLRALSHRQMVSLDEADESAVVDLFSLYTKFDRAHVEETFTQWRLESWRQKALQFPIIPDEGRISLAETEVLVINRHLMERWAKSITNRRRVFSYWERHSKKLALRQSELVFKSPSIPTHQSSKYSPSQQLTQTLELAQPAPTLPVAETMVLSETEFTLASRLVDTVSNNSSAVSRISTAYNIDETASNLPPAPSLAPGEMEARCPYCHLVCPAKEFQHSRWRKHIIQDLQPYMCTRNDCPDPNIMYGTRSAWLSHEAQIHRKVFRCFEHPENFSSRESLEHHFTSLHQELGRGQIEAMLDLGQASHQEERVSCPFCLSTGPFFRGFFNHMAYHQERLACFAATGQSLNRDDGLYSDTDSDKAQRDDDPDALQLLDSDISSRGSGSGKGSKSFPIKKNEVIVSLGKEIRQAMVQSVGPDDDSDPEPSTSLFSSKYLPIDQLNSIINYDSILNELREFDLFKEPDLSRIVMEVQGDIDFKRNAKLDPGPTGSTTICAASPTRKKIFAILVLMGKAPTISDICDEGLSDDDLPFHLDPNGLKLVRRAGTSSQPIQAFINWKEHESDMFDSYQWYMLAPYFVLAHDDDPRVTHYTVRYMVPLPFSVTESVQNSAISPVCGYLGMQKITIHHAHHSQGVPKQSNQNVFAVKTFRDIEAKEYDLRFKSLLRLSQHRHPHFLQLLLGLTHGSTKSFIFRWADCDLEQFWANNPPGNDAVDMARWISSQLFGLADALQLIRDLFPSGVLAENDHRLQPPHRDLSPGRILCFETKGITQCVLKIADFGSMQYHDDQAYDQRGSEICTDSAYRAPELLTGGLAPNSDLWSFGCIILHFIVWYHGGWALVNSLSASSSAEEEQASDDNKFFKSGNLNITRPSLDPRGLTEGDTGGAVTGQDKGVPNVVVLKESIKQGHFQGEGTKDIAGGD